MGKVKMKTSDEAIKNLLRETIQKGCDVIEDACLTANCFKYNETKVQLKKSLDNAREALKAFNKESKTVKPPRKAN
jgi:hypothetical protein